MRIRSCFFALVTFLITGCVSPEQRFKNGLDGRINWNIERYQSQNGVNFVRSEETIDGKVEYFYEYKTRGFFDPAGSKCRYAMVVDKSTQLIVSWHFIGNHDYCRVSN
ncbi:MAG: hypothetical protein ABL858_03150 [Candidatus Nitrotoga sp.]